jgi:DNA polymerase-4
VSDPTRRILHVDMDAFFVSVELLDRPELRGQPVIVGGTGGRGVVAAASYEARAYGVHSAMPTVTARRLCPQAVYLDGRHARYREASREVMAIFERFTPVVEPLSLDEAFLDVTGSVRAFGPATDIAARIRADVLSDVGLTCSVGVATNKFLAKLGSEAAKPTPSPQGPIFGSGIFEVEPGGELNFLRPLPVQSLWGVGRATLAKLSRLGVRTVGELADLPEFAVTAALGDAVGRHLYRLSHALDDRPVIIDQRPKSVSHEETFAVDQPDRNELDRELIRMADSVASRLRGAALSGRTVTLKVRFGSFETITRSQTSPVPLDDGTAIALVAGELLDRIDVSVGIRLLGVGVSNLEEGAARQLSFDGIDQHQSGTHEVTNRAVDEIRARFGASAIGPARLATGSRVATFEPGEQQWGPTGSEAK